MGILRGSDLTETASMIYSAFVKYNNNFIRITKRAKERFEKKDFSGSQKDLIERIALYDKSVTRSRSLVADAIGSKEANTEVWERLRLVYWKRVSDIPNGEFSKTFFNSVHRDYLRSVGLNPTRVSDTTNIVSKENPNSENVDKKDYLVWQNLHKQVARILGDFKLSSKYADPDRDLVYVYNRILSAVENVNSQEDDIRRIEILNSLFFQSGRAFLVGKVIYETNKHIPLAIAYTNRKNGILVESVLTTTNEISTLFGFSRSYFMVDLEPIEGTVSFISSLLPAKPIDEIYTVLGRTRQGKTERARALNIHLNKAKDKFQHAPGTRGMVMSVFTLTTYSLVFKVIKDDFGHSKNISREQVKQKYKLVFNHDRAGRLIDTQEFRNIEFPLNKFEPDLIEDLLTVASKTVQIVNDKIRIGHLYTERKVTPLDLYLANNHLEIAIPAVIDYGKAIKELALSNIFPGDFLLKNFGVTRQGRVIFYDYDELCLITDCNFRSLPKFKHHEDEMRPNDWFFVGKNDVFPEEFIRFLAFKPGLKTAFLEHHGDILTPLFWQRIKELHLSKKPLEVAPYHVLKKS
tara:strand:+ start:391 stop:2118 length:1728 start_codon:yes stop_codon:yes gene_type:complete